MEKNNKLPAGDSPSEKKIIGQGPVVNIESGEVVGHAFLKAEISTINDSLKRASGEKTKVGFTPKYGDNFDTAFGSN